MLLQGWDVGEENLGLQKNMVSQKKCFKFVWGHAEGEGFALCSNTPVRWSEKVGTLRKALALKQI